MKVWTNGCYDSLTHAHIKLFEYAKSLDPNACLIVGIDSDRRVRERKGYGRPFHSEQQRKFNIESIRFVDVVVVFDTDEELETLIRNTDPEYMVIGKEYENKKVVGREHAHNLVFFDTVKSPSSTQLINDENSK
jgi:D-beta-D-heptose 7-phosphate kinase/D-beta-D-heptose 1-phosphate adenosyltransferase